jgi:hypothetical protein
MNRSSLKQAIKQSGSRLGPIDQQLVLTYRGEQCNLASGYVSRLPRESFCASLHLGNDVDKFDASWTIILDDKSKFTLRFNVRMVEVAGSCGRCRRLVDSLESSLHLLAYCHAPSLATLRTSANEGCPLCTLLWQAVEREAEKSAHSQDWLYRSCSSERPQQVLLRADMDLSRIFLECSMGKSLPRYLGSVALYSKSGRLLI